MLNRNNEFKDEDVFMLPKTRFFGLFQDHVSLIQEALYKNNGFNPANGNTPTTDNVGDFPRPDYVTFVSVFLRTFAFSQSKGTSVDLGVENQFGDFSWKFFAKVFFGFHPEVSSIKSTFGNILALPFRLPINLIKLATELLPGYLHHLFDDYLFKTDAAEKSIQTLKSEEGIISDFKQIARFLMTVGVSALWLTTLAIYDIGRALTSPVESMQAALHFVSDEFNRKHPIVSTLITLPLVLGSLALTAVGYAIGGIFAGNMIVASKSFGLMSPYVTPVGEAISAFINLPAVTSIVGSLGLNLGLLSAPVLGFVAINTLAPIVIDSLKFMVSSTIDYFKKQSVLNRNDEEAVIAVNEQPSTFAKLFGCFGVDHKTERKQKTTSSRQQQSVYSNVSSGPSLALNRQILTIDGQDPYVGDVDTSPSSTYTPGKNGK